MSPRRLWHRLREPRIVTALTGVMWLIVIAIGAAALIDPPTTIASEIGPALTALWACFLLAGGILGGLGCVILPEPWWRWIEQTGIISASTGAIIYAGVVLSLHITEPGSRLVQPGFILVAVVLLAARWVRISDPATHYRRERTHGVDH